MNKYPGVFFIDAHQTSSGYFFPPNEDPVHHEISHFALDFIQNGIGPALQDAFNAQSIAFRNYSQYDLFTPEYGDTIPSLVMGAAGMTYEKGTSEAYAKQVYDHYLAIDTTIKAAVEDKVSITSRWVAQWKEAVDQGANCQLQPNTLVSPLHDTIKQQPQGNVCGYFFKPDQHTGDTAAMIDLLQSIGVRVFRLDTPVAVNGYHEFGNSGAAGRRSVNGQTLPAGTLWIPMDQGMKHYIQALLGENPFIPYDYYYDVVTWSYPLQRGLAGLRLPDDSISPRRPDVGDHGTDYGTIPSEASPVYAFNTDSARGLALAIDLLDNDVNVYRGRAAVHLGRQAVLHRRGARRRRVAGRLRARPDSLENAGGQARHAGHRPARLPGPAPPAERSEDRALHQPGDDSVESAVPRGPERQRHHASLRADQRRLGVLRGAARPRRQARAAASSRIVPVTSDDLEADKLFTERFTAFINPGSAIATTTGTPPVLTRTGTALQKFINNGGIYVGTDTNGASAARSVGATTLDTAASADYSGLYTPGSTFDATFDTDNPVAWGFDLGGWIYRNATSNPVFDPTTLGSAHAGREVRRHPGREVRLRDQRAQARHPPGGRRLPVRHRACRSDRVQPVLSLLEGAGRAARAQRGALPEGRGARAEPGDAASRSAPAPPAAEINAPAAAAPQGQRPDGRAGREGAGDQRP